MILGVGVCLTSGAIASAGQPSSKIQVLSYNRRNFLIPFEIPPEEIPRTKQIQLCSSSDGGATWRAVAVTTPERQYFNFKAKSDGVYWFAARRVDPQGRLFPSNDADVEPNMKVTIDTTKPEISIDPRARRGNLASFAWEVTDEALDLSTLAFDYQVEGTDEWIPIPLAKQPRIGIESWNAGTSLALKVRGTVADVAKNRQVQVASLPGGGIPDDFRADPTDLAAGEVPPAIGTFASNETTRPAPSPARPRRADADLAGDHDPFAGDEADARSGGHPGGPPPGGGAAPAPVLVASPKFDLKYAVDDAGPNGPATVELYVTTDEGRTWASRGEDADKTSPFGVDLGGEGRYGLRLVAKSAADQGDRPPVAGDVPQTVVDVDTSGPAVTVDRPTLAGNKLRINWRATDPHPTPRPVMISVRSDSPGSKWEPITRQPVENTGQFVWSISPRCPPKIYVRVDVRDALGNLGFAETTDAGPTTIDQTKPKSRIVGLEPIARPGP